ncbi:hypothetical protein [Litorilituus sediminis]|uniref:von Hippel-Lindau disease tumour suppressor beta domain-containing protein n=1 Tax=Litorilituus sediminis TaxID=718192 RepID=A0A4P6P0M2_9GAMM|nr:hypothetical protein [Litorilituus sediminis]QBG34344.1 hypothetical protein EMK97_00595 [Litorilituus sediminis]
MSNKLASVLVFALTSFASQQSFAEQCYVETSTGGGPSGPATCIDISVDNIDGTSVSLSATAVRYGDDISNYIIWSSDIDGNIGYGTSTVAELTPGTHKVTAVAQVPHLRPYIDEETIVIASPEDTSCSNIAPSTAETFDEYYGIEFTNNRESDIKVYWLKYENAERIYYYTLAQGERVTQTGYPGNKWLVTDANDNCLSVHTNGYQADYVTIN